MTTGRHFQDQVVLVTGAGRGIGAAIARAFAAEGASVVVNYVRNASTAQAVAEDCVQLGGDGLAIQADVCNTEQVKAMVAQTLAEFGRIDAVVNNAFAPYVFDPEQRASFESLTYAHYQTQFDGAVRACFEVCQAVLPHFKQRCAGSITNLVSDLVARPSVPYHDYATAKSALLGYSRNLAAELGQFNIRVNCVAPGLVYPTDASRTTKEDVKNLIASQTPLRRIATPQDVAGPVLFLASPWSGFMTGQVLYVDGGWVMG